MTKWITLLTFDNLFPSSLRKLVVESDDYGYCVLKDSTTLRQRERLKETIGLISKTTTFALFVHFFAVFSRLGKRLMSCFMENVNNQRRIFISLSEPEYGPFKYKFRRFRVHLTKQVRRNNRDKEWKNANSLFKRRSRCCCVVGNKFP